MMHRGVQAIQIKEFRHKANCAKKRDTSKSVRRRGWSGLLSMDASQEGGCRAEVAVALYM
eukprot:365387-Chlamydomonas_euryale.AAC.18